MNKKAIAIIVWAIVFLLSLTLLFIIPREIENCVFVVAIFDCIAFTSQFLLWKRQYGSEKTSEEVFFMSPVKVMSAIYLLAQFILCIITGVLARAISVKLSLILCTALAALMWILILSSLGIQGHSVRIDSRQKNHHIEL